MSLCIVTLSIRCFSRKTSSATSSSSINDGESATACADVCMWLFTYLTAYGNPSVGIRLDWIEQGLTSHSTHFRSFWRRWGDCGISQDCSRSQSPQCARCWVVCARPLLTTVCVLFERHCVCIRFRCPARTVVSMEHAFTFVSTTNQAERRSSATHLLARWEHERTTAWWSRAQGGGPSVISTAGIYYKLRRL